MEDKIKAIRDWPVPEKLHDIRSFLGLCVFYRRFIHNFSSRAKPLTQLIRKSQQWIWGTQQQKAMDDIKSALIQAFVLAHPQELPWVVTTNACLEGIRGVLMQEHLSGLRHVAFESHKLSDDETRYSVHELQLLAIVHCLRKWRAYLEGREFIPRSDNHSLVWLDQQKQLSKRQSRWLEFLAPYTFKVVHIAGKDNVVADALSICPKLLNTLGFGGGGMEEKKVNAKKKQQVDDETSGYQGLGSCASDLRLKQSSNILTRKPLGTRLMNNFRGPSRSKYEGHIVEQDVNTMREPNVIANV